jgi:hypothetical protein
VGIQILEQGDELHTPVALLNARGDVPVVQVQTRQNRPGGKRRFATGEADRDGFSPRRSAQASGAWMLVPSTQHSTKQNYMDMLY